LRLKAKPQNLATTLFISRRFVNVNENRFLCKVDEVEGTFLFCIPVKFTVIDRARPVASLEITNPVCDVLVRSHDPVEVTLCEWRII
jgi:hypothetical protein